ncbi:MAG: LysM peptidoglycan-binding domain-containing protein [Candidatus Sericytochromatia bacterium]|nr:LysM peptidoglycan-binding domain-containing protein [Candidatus Tanganyikabacteria bacterium]
MARTALARNHPLTRADDSIFLELEWLQLMADDGAVAGDFAQVLRRSRMWRLVHPRPRRFPSQAVAIVATAALFPRIALAEAPAVAATATLAAETQVTVSVMDAKTHKPVAGAILRSKASGERKGVTDSLGRVRVPVDAIKGQDLVVEKPGYRPLQVVASRARPGSAVFVGIVPTGEPVAAVATAKPTPEAHAAAPTPRPKPTPRPEVWQERGTPRPTPAFEEDEPTPEPEHEATPAPAPRAKSTPAPKVVRKPGRKRVRTVRVAARTAPDMAARHGGRYRVLPGDTLWSIAHKEYGNAYFWSALYVANRRKVRDPDLIYPGQWLNLPDGHLARGKGHLAARTARVTVRRGDSLWELAGHHLGDPYKWTDIYRLNRGVISDPRVILPGQVLRLPTV